MNLPLRLMIISCLLNVGCDSQEKQFCTQEDFITFANEHWNFKRWAENYYAWENYEKSYSEGGLYIGDTVYIDGINYRSLFSIVVGENEYDYSHINESSHSISFYDPRYDEYVTFNEFSIGLSGEHFYCSDYGILNGEFVCFKWELNANFQSLLDNGEIMVQNVASQMLWDKKV